MQVEAKCLLHTVRVNFVPKLTGTIDPENFQTKKLFTSSESCFCPKNSAVLLNGCGGVRNLVVLNPGGILSTTQGVLTLELQ